jgi:4,5-DOPA dioxygenase extradiol
MFPLADIPVLQLSLNVHLKPEQHVSLAKELAVLRKKGVLIIGSGNIVHNLGRLNWNGGAYDWAVEFDQDVRKHLSDRDIKPLINYSGLGKNAALSIPSAEHYLPMLYIAGLIQPTDKIQFFNESVSLGSISMTSFLAS